MSLFLIIFLSAFMVVDCAVLVFLVLMQLPKKEAGAGLAFGGAATDALFGAGSGNFLTKATKYTAGLFFALAILLSVLQSWRAHQPGSDFLERIKQHQNEQAAIVAPPTAPSNTATTNIVVIPSAQSLPTTVTNLAAPTNAAPAATVPAK